LTNGPVIWLLVDQWTSDLVVSISIDQWCGYWSAMDQWSDCQFINRPV